MHQMETLRLAMRVEDRTAALCRPFSWSSSVSLASFQQCHRTSAMIQVTCHSFLLDPRYWTLSNKQNKKTVLYLSIMACSGYLQYVCCFRTVLLNVFHFSLRKLNNSIHRNTLLFLVLKLNCFRVFKIEIEFLSCWN